MEVLIMLFVVRLFIAGITYEVMKRAKLHYPQCNYKPLLYFWGCFIIPKCCWIFWIFAVIKFFIFKDSNVVRKNEHGEFVEVNPKAFKKQQLEKELEGKSNLYIKLFTINKLTETIAFYALILITIMAILGFILG